MPMLSDDSIALQDEWILQLGGTVSELQSVAGEACRHHEGYLAALGRMGELYAHCGRLMVRANNPVLAAPHLIDAAADARRVATQLQLSIDQWRHSSDELALRSFLQNQQAQWKMWEDEVQRSVAHHKRRLTHSRTIAEVRQNVKAAEKRNKYMGEELKFQLEQLEAARKPMDVKVQKEIEENAKLCSKDLIKFGIEFIDQMSKSGQMCAVSFQPIGFADVAVSAAKVVNGSASSRSAPTESVLGVVLHRPSPRDVVDDGAETVDGVSYTRSYTYQRDSTRSSQVAPSLLPNRPSTS
ncbi:hypothetical protein ABB37_09485 [Leptomonas pyrrhocoris]|uniref:Uncharacterized protein n=1 Tax=Leptomonas pyrrhocoris TaxID=157538 RepID=A0A0M9FQC6_LEPPY|nr:hypothetical protein ABB37_09485 [Leptomonas pyrrhocoris]XP_015652285.1 hypothetical protein ABB37_09485 [Leptomonas pyrrhocoris]XP_015652286.1 hypothetical protein ABB37_09485 [Leptomonas pyrrhocoris]KPA73845.1 hypothetical protein ABB37_09485 [Leptomonas pyrrhocoris]KPA73846.1 hypothetical protein ABB37_09485 [Leptomonas pyrrhocoris]KPA73847.1 hypothetical protein ABB37_09485 [Leptomonas pyrrhocoris]|eukprot:XP_015652284.1 hypothetical protein ABB37_09485 [Leptomonas pyrrhocoris]